MSRRDPHATLTRVAKISTRRNTRNGDMDDGSLSLPVDAAIQRLSEGRAAPCQTVQERLAARFGFGDNPTKRRIFYDRVAKAIELHGSAAEALVGEAVQMASAARPGKRDHYFCRALVAKLREAGFWGTEGW